MDVGLTRGLVPTIVIEQVVPRQELVLMHMMYPKADWTKPFLPELISERAVHYWRGRLVTVPFMHDPEPLLTRQIRPNGSASLTNVTGK